MTQFVSGLFDSTNDLPTFKNHIRDFLVQSKEFSAQVSVTNIPFISRFLGLYGLGMKVFYFCTLSLYVHTPAEPNRLSILCF